MSSLKKKRNKCSQLIYPIDNSSNCDNYNLKVILGLLFGLYFLSIILSYWFRGCFAKVGNLLQESYITLFGHLVGFRIAAASNLALFVALPVFSIIATLPQIYRSLPSSTWVSVFAGWSSGSLLRKVAAPFPYKSVPILSLPGSQKNYLRNSSIQQYA